MTIYFYLSNTPTESQISRVKTLSLLVNDITKISFETTYGNEIRFIIETFPDIYSIDVLTLLQEQLKQIFNTSAVFIR